MNVQETLLYLAADLFSIYVVYRFYSLFFEHSRCKKCILILGFLIYFLIDNVGFLCFQRPMINLVTNLMSLFALTFLYQGNLRLRILTAVLIYAVLMICDAIAYRILILMEGKDDIVGGMAANGLLMLIIEVIFEKYMNFRTGKMVTMMELLYIITVPCISIFIVGVILNMAISTELIALATIGILIINIVMFFLLNHISGAYKKLYEMALRKQQWEALSNQLSLQRDSEEKAAALRHDMRNHLLMLKRLADLKKYDELDQYFKEMENAAGTITYYVNSGNTVIDGILNWKLREAAQCGAEPTYTVHLPEKLNISDMDMNIILSNLLDNSIQALKESSVSKELAVSMIYERNILRIEIKNTYEGKVVSHHGKLITTKHSRIGHGIGLQSVEWVVQKYMGNIDLEYDGKRFCVTILLYLS